MKLKAVRNGELLLQTSPNMFEGEDLGNGGGTLEQQLQHEQLKMEQISQVRPAYILIFLSIFFFSTAAQVE